MPDVIDLDGFKDRRAMLEQRRIFAEIEEDEAYWNALCYGMVDLMVRSHLSDTAVTSAGLRAILDVLTESMPLDEAKAAITRTLKAFR